MKKCKVYEMVMNKVLKVCGIVWHMFISTEEGYIRERRGRSGRGGSNEEKGGMKKGKETE